MNALTWPFANELVHWANVQGGEAAKQLRPTGGAAGKRTDEVEAQKTSVPSSTILFLPEVLLYFPGAQTNSPFPSPAELAQLCRGGAAPGGLCLGLVGQWPAGADGCAPSGSPRHRLPGTDLRGEGRPSTRSGQVQTPASPEKRTNNYSTIKTTS